jgi:serine/threonine-protein kinase
VDDTEAASEGELDAGDEVAGNHILEKLGDGDYGPVYLAEQGATGRLVALKILTADSGTWAKGYLDAIYASGQLVHNNIVLIYDTGEVDGRYYVSREYVEGQSLAGLLERKERLPMDEAQPKLVQIVEGLRHARDRGINHGCLAPCNVLVSKDGMVKLTNFGLGQVRAPGFPSPMDDMAVLPYLPPEVVRRDTTQPGFVGDCYSVGSIFFHMMTGQPPFHGGTLEEIRNAILSSPTPKPEEYAPNIPHVAGQIAERCLDKISGARYQQPKELLYDLEELLRREI